MEISASELRSYFDPWPICFKDKSKFLVSMVKSQEALTYLSCWRDANGRRRTVAAFAKMIETDNYAGARHHIRSYARSGAARHRPFIVTEDREDGKPVVYDGNHTLMALWLLNDSGYVLRIHKMEKAAKRDKPKKYKKK